MQSGIACTVKRTKWLSNGISKGIVCILQKSEDKKSCKIIQNEISYICFQINLLNPAFGKTSGDRDKSVGQMINELQVMRQEMRHPNIVRYHKTFREGKVIGVKCEYFLIHQF